MVIITYTYCEEEQTFTVIRFELGAPACRESGGTYNFKIIGETNIASSKLSAVKIDLVSPAGAQAECDLFPRYSNSEQYLSCSIDICLYTLNKANILLPLKTPTSNKCKILNWEEVIGSKEGESNLVDKNVVCLPKSDNTFITSSLKSNGCSGNKNTFSIFGKWSIESKLPTLNSDITIKLNNEKNDLASCKIRKDSPEEIKCEFNGEGDVKFEDSFVKATDSVYQILKAESSIHVDKCSESKSESQYIFMNILFFSLIIILLF